MNRPTMPFILISGFGWSGASAAVDLLREASVTQLPALGEIRQVKAALQYMRPWRVGIHDAKGMAMARDAKGRFLRHEPNLAIFRSHLESQGLLQDFEAEMARLFPKRESYGESFQFLLHSRRQRFLTEYFSAILSVIEVNQKVTLCDNLISGSKIKTLSYLQASKLPPHFCVIVDRDLKDVYADQVQNNWICRNTNFEAFRRSELRNRAKSYSALKRLQIPSMSVRFEELVARDSDAANRLRCTVTAWLKLHGLEPAWSLRSHFQPEVSARNVGIGKSHNT